MSLPLGVRFVQSPVALCIRCWFAIQRAINNVCSYALDCNCTGHLTVLRPCLTVPTKARPILLLCQCYMYAACRVGLQLEPNDKGLGVLGVVEADFLQPTHNKQDFDDTPAYRYLI